MNATALLIGLGPLLGWGLFPTIASKIGGRPVNQILGTSLGTLIFAAIFSMINGLAFPAGMDLFFSILSGVGWACAQIITFKCFTMIGSSRAMPVTTAFQLLGASLWGVFFLGNWPGATAKLLGAFALVLIGYWAYSAAPQATAIDGMHAFLPQAIGMVIVAVIYSAVVTIKGGETSPFIEAVSYKQIFSGFFFAFAALTYLISAQPDMNGLATGFILSQTSVVLATLTGIWFLGQKKTAKEMTVTIIGLVLILAAATITVMI